MSGGRPLLTTDIDDSFAVIRRRPHRPLPAPRVPQTSSRLSRFNCAAAQRSTGSVSLSAQRDNDWEGLWKWFPTGRGSNPKKYRGGRASIESLAAQEIASLPKQRLGKKWKEYQGSNNWKGLLDPLDENLRAEIVKYGDFVGAAYNAFDFDPRSKSYGSCKYRKRTLLDNVGLRHSGYRVTRNIYATSSLRLPKWLTDLASCDPRGKGMDAPWVGKRSSWVGFVAVCDDSREIARLGRRDIVVAYRGTATPFEWAENLRDVLTPAWNDSEAKVQAGFWNLYTWKGPTGRSAADQVMSEVRRLAELYKGESVSITVTGHSLGAALALLTACQIGADLKNSSNRAYRVPVTVFSFGGPRVGNRAFGRRLEEQGCKVLRIVNANDVITKVPGVLFNERCMHRLTHDKAGRLARILEKMPWAYCHVGTEFRVNNRHSPYLKPNADVACCHDLEVYLHLIDGFHSSATPFRSSATRDILRLLLNQKSNVLLKPGTSNGIARSHGIFEPNNNTKNKSYSKGENWLSRGRKLVW